MPFLNKPKAEANYFGYKTKGIEEEIKFPESSEPRGLGFLNHDLNK